MKNISSPGNLGKYSLVGQLARGGMGIVYLAQLQGPGGFQKLVVVKELDPELPEGEAFRAMFLEEATLAARLNHRNIVQTNEVGQHDGRYYMAMDYLDGASLHAVLTKLRSSQRVLPLGMSLQIASEVLAGLHYAHELTDYDGSSLGVVHRDVGPQNIILTNDGQVKLIDFGVAKALNRGRQTEAGMLKGRIAYMAPEQVAGMCVDRRADIFAVGLLLREMLSSKRVWSGHGDVEILRLLMNGSLPPWPEANDLLPELRAVCERASAPDRDDRFATAAEMRGAVEQIIARVGAEGALKEVGPFVASMFEHERRQLGEFIEARLAIKGGSVRALATSLFDGGNAQEGQSSRRPSISGRHPRSSSKAPVSSAAPLANNAVEIPVPSDDRTTGEGGRARTARAWIATGLVATCGAMIGAWVIPRAHPAPAPAPAAARVATAVPSSALPVTSVPPVEVVEMTIHVTPRNAQIFLNDVPLRGNPARVMLDRSDALHFVRVAAPGFVPKTESVRADLNSSVTISLERLSVPSAPAPRPPEPRPLASSSPAPAASGAKPDIEPKGGKAPKREIDPKNPYLGLGGGG